MTKSQATAGHILLGTTGTHVKVPHSIHQLIWKTQQWPQGGEMSIFVLISKRGSAKECSGYWTIALTSYASKVMLKIPQAKLQQYLN